MFKRYYKGILIPIAIIAIFIFTIFVDGGAECGNYSVTAEATVQVVVTLADGNTFIVDEKVEDVTYNTYNSSNVNDWEFTNY